MKRLLLIAACAVATLALNSCGGPQYPQCETDEHCAEHGEFCVQGQCQECGVDENCKDGFVCRENACVPKPECQSSDECGKCSMCKDEKCVPECTEDSQCGDGRECRSGCCADIPQCVTDADCDSGQRCQKSKCVSPDEASPVCNLSTVRFDYNEHSLSAAARASLDANAECIRAMDGVVTLAGHADERGTEEYNLHLGEKRANAVKRYLLNLGVPEARLRTISYGEERPLNKGHTEKAWEENRRVDFSD